MASSVKKITLWRREMDDRPGTLAQVLAPLARAGDAWPQFRGPDGQGHAAAKGLPVLWSETENIRWKVPIPGLGWSSPATGSTSGGRHPSCSIVWSWSTLS